MDDVAKSTFSLEMDQNCTGGLQKVWIFLEGVSFISKLLDVLKIGEGADSS